MEIYTKYNFGGFGALGGNFNPIYIARVFADTSSINREKVCLFQVRLFDCFPRVEVRHLALDDYPLADGGAGFHVVLLLERERSEHILEGLIPHSPCRHPRGVLHSNGDRWCGLRFSLLQGFWLLRPLERARGIHITN